MTRKDNVEYFHGRADYKTGVALSFNPYPMNLQQDSRYLRWVVGWRDAETISLKQWVSSKNRKEQMPWQ